MGGSRRSISSVGSLQREVSNVSVPSRNTSIRPTSPTVPPAFTRTVSPTRERPMPASQGKGYVGFAVKGYPGKQGIYICDVDPTGPAFKAGLKEGDLLVVFAGVPVSDLGGFRRAFSQNVVPGRELHIETHRGSQSIATVVTVAVKSQERPRPFSKITSAEEARRIVDDGMLLLDAANAAFDTVDADSSGLISREEYFTAVRSLFSPRLAEYATTPDLEHIFEKSDEDTSGFLARKEFPMVLAILIRTVIGNARKAGQK